jgi:hypothetical protein
MIEAPPCCEAKKRKHIVVDVPKPNFDLKGKLQDHEISDRLSYRN